MNYKSLIYLLGLASLETAAVAAGGGIVTSTESGQYSQIDACKAAKDRAKGAASLDAARYGSIANVRITNFSPCSCESYAGPGTPPITLWKCSVDATYSQ